MSSGNRLSREKHTLDMMVNLYCRGHHVGAGALCPQCDVLARYASGKIDTCTFHAAKPVCARCRVHCFGKEMRDSIKKVMRYSGPRMAFHHPFLASLHAWDSLTNRAGGKRTPAEEA